MTSTLPPNTNINHGQYCPSWGLSVSGAGNADMGRSIADPCDAPSLPNSIGTEPSCQSNASHSTECVGQFGQCHTRQRLKRSTRQVFGESVRGKAVRIPEEGRRESRGCSPRNIEPIPSHLTGWARHLISLPHGSSKGRSPLPLTATPSGLRGFL